MSKIVDLEAFSFETDNSWLTNTVVANPMSIYPKYHDKRSSWMKPLCGVFAKITLDNGLYGWGWAGGGKDASKVLIEGIFKNLIVGNEVSDIEYMWDIMYRSSIPYGRRGMTIEAISAVEIALWDAFGKDAGLPVYKLLGGKVRDKQPVYVTSNNKASGMMGIKSRKLAVPFGPADGAEGMKKNKELVRSVREELGDDGDLMLDCYMGWDEEYAIKMVKLIADYDIRWIEEPLIPENYDGYKRLRAIFNPMGILVTGGEHEFTRYGFKYLIENRCMDIIQPDVSRAGGISEFKKICAMASAYGLTVIPHGTGSPTYHAAINSTVSPFAEYIDINIGNSSAANFINEPVPVDGYIQLEDTPGFGYEINPLLFEGKKPMPIW